MYRGQHVAGLRENSIQHDRKVWNNRRIRYSLPVHAGIVSDHHQVSLHYCEVELQWLVVEWFLMGFERLSTSVQDMHYKAKLFLVLTSLVNVPL